MKKLIVSFLAVVMLTGLAGSLAAAGIQNDFQAVKKAVKENPVYESGKEVKWFKVLVTDAKTNKDKVRITLPISLVEVFVKCAENKHVRMNRQTGLDSLETKAYVIAVQFRSEAGNDYQADGITVTMTFVLNQ